jgi:hypothetical protein
VIYEPLRVTREDIVPFGERLIFAMMTPREYSPGEALPSTHGDKQGADLWPGKYLFESCKSRHEKSEASEIR